MPREEILAFTNEDCITDADQVREGIIPLKAEEVDRVISKVAMDSPNRILKS